MIRMAVQRTCSCRVASETLPPELATALLESFWESRQGSTEKQAFASILNAVSRLLDVAKKAPKIWEVIKEGLGLHIPDTMGWIERAKVMAKKIKDLAAEGRAVLGKALHHVAQTFPLSLYFVPHNKAPSLTDLLARILKKSPKIWALVEKIHSGAEHVDAWMKKYIPHLSRGLYAAIFIWVWINVAELSWDIEGILNGFLGRISLGDLLASMPESGIGLIASIFGLGYGALPYVLIARILWLVANRFLSWVPGKGLVVHWSKMGVNEHDEMVETT